MRRNLPGLATRGCGHRRRHANNDAANPTLSLAAAISMADIYPQLLVQTVLNPNRTGTYHLFCSQFCGTEHAEMGGSVTVMGAGEFQQWLAANATGGTLVAEEAPFIAASAARDVMVAEATSMGRRWRDSTAAR